MMFTQSFFPGVLDGICNLKLLCGKSQLFLAQINGSDVANLLVNCRICNNFKGLPL